MARKKKTEPIKSLGSDDNKLMVQKSLPLFSLWQSNLTLAEFKILDTYLSRIDSHNPEKRTVVFTKGELEKILGVDRIRTADLKERLKHLMGNVIELPNPELKKGFWLISLFEEAEAEQDDFGFWEVTLECTSKAMRYIFNVENIGYLRYKLTSIANITSRYTYIMFCYLEHNRFRKNWEIDLEKLKKILNCNTEETYRTYKRLNDLILKKVQKELNEKTHCSYNYEPIKKGRRVVAIKFTVHNLDHVEASEPLITKDNSVKNEICRDNICSGFENEIFEDFTAIELEILKNLAWNKVCEEDVILNNKILNNKILAHEAAVTAYITNKVYLAKKNKAKNLFAYVQKSILA